MAAIGALDTVNGQAHYHQQPRNDYDGSRAAMQYALALEGELEATETYLMQLEHDYDALMDDMFYTEHPYNNGQESNGKKNFKFEIQRLVRYFDLEDINKLVNAERTVVFKMGPKSIEVGSELEDENANINAAISKWQKKNLPDVEGALYGDDDVAYWQRITYSYKWDSYTPKTKK